MRSFHSSQPVLAVPTSLLRSRGVFCVRCLAICCWLSLSGALGASLSADERFGEPATQAAKEAQHASQLRQPEIDALLRAGEAQEVEREEKKQQAETRAAGTSFLAAGLRRLTASIAAAFGSSKTVGGGDLGTAQGRGRSRLVRRETRVSGNATAPSQDLTPTVTSLATAVAKVKHGASSTGLSAAVEGWLELCPEGVEDAVLALLGAFIVFCVSACLSRCAARGCLRRCQALLFCSLRCGCGRRRVDAADGDKASELTNELFENERRALAEVKSKQLLLERSNFREHVSQAAEPEGEPEEQRRRAASEASAASSSTGPYEPQGQEALPARSNLEN